MQCLRQDASQRPSCSQLLRHPFVLKATVLEADFGTQDGRGLDELRAVILALYQHLQKLSENSGKESSVLLTACKDLNTIDTLRLLLFGEDRRLDSSNNFASKTTAAMRLSVLANQLHLDVDLVVNSARQIFSEIQADLDRSSVSGLVETPKNHNHNKPRVFYNYDEP